MSSLRGSHSLPDSGNKLPALTSPCVYAICKTVWLYIFFQMSAKLVCMCWEWSWLVHCEATAKLLSWMSSKIHLLYSPWLRSSLHKQVLSFQWPWGSSHCEVGSWLFEEVGGGWSLVCVTDTNKFHLCTLFTLCSCLANMALYLGSHWKENR